MVGQWNFDSIREFAYLAIMLEFFPLPLTDDRAGRPYH